MTQGFRVNQTILPNGHYLLNEEITYHSPRYGKDITAKAGEDSDGATGAFDVVSRGWWLHDVACKRGTWDDGTPMSNWQCSQLLQDVMVEESPKGWKRVRSGRWWQSRYWFWSTWLLGGGEARKNGMVKVAGAGA
jgi:hypothetical protein